MGKGLIVFPSSLRLTKTTNTVHQCWWRMLATNTVLSEQLGNYVTNIFSLFVTNIVLWSTTLLETIFYNLKKTTPCKRVSLQLSSSTQQTKTWLLSINELDRFQAGDSDIFQIIDRIGSINGKNRVGAGGR